jgi:hypothetical protein
MATKFQLVIDCENRDLLARFWAAALGYVLEPPPEGFTTWDDWCRFLERRGLMSSADGRRLTAQNLAAATTAGTRSC